MPKQPPEPVWHLWGSRKVSPVMSAPSVSGNQPLLFVSIMLAGPQTKTDLCLPRVALRSLRSGCPPPGQPHLFLLSVPVGLPGLPHRYLPLDPVDLHFPSDRSLPALPCHLSAPCGPAGPASPAGPRSPVAPTGPVSPRSPLSPFGP